jgi:hypothetical protein
MPREQGCREISKYTPETSSSNPDIFGEFKLANLRAETNQFRAQCLASLDDPAMLRI